LIFLAIDSLLFRKVLGHFATGVTVVTTKSNDELLGLTVNAFSAVSLSPPLVLVCIESAASTCEGIKKSGIFAVSILSFAQQEVSSLFARKGFKGKFESVRTRSMITNSPVLENALAFVECNVRSTYPEGDHTIFVGEVINLGLLSDQNALTFYTGKYYGLDLRTTVSPNIPRAEDTYLSWLWPSS